jgi:hypothetical protein
MFRERRHASPVRLPAVIALLLAAHWPVESRAAHDFTETNDDAVCCLLSDNLHINRAITLFGADDLFARSELTSFHEDNALPVENGGDLELLWDNGAFGLSATIALTPDDEDGNYPLLAVELQSDLAFHGDLESAEAEGGVVLRHVGPEDPGSRKFYCAYGAVPPRGAGLEIVFRIQRWEGAGFVDLQGGAVVSAAYEYHDADNIRIAFEAGERDADGDILLTARLYRLSSVGGILSVVHLETISGTDRALTLGQVGYYAKAGSIGSQIAFDNGALAVLGPTPTRTATMGEIKAKFVKVR